MYEYCYSNLGAIYAKGLFICVNEFLTNFMGRLKSSDRLHVDVNESYMFWCPLGHLKNNLSHLQTQAPQRCHLHSR